MFGIKRSYHGYTGVLMHCEFLSEKNTCSIVSRMANRETFASDALCRMCKRSKQAKALNIHTISAAIQSIVKTGQKVPTFLLREYDRISLDLPSEKSFVSSITISPRLVWRKLHLYPFSVKTWSETEAKKWYIEWKKLIPEYCRSCGSHWSEMEKRFQPDFTSREAFFEWGVARHNDVSNRIRAKQGGHPEMPLSEAYALYSALADADLNTAS